MIGSKQGVDKNEVDEVQMNDDNVEVIVVQMDDVQEEKVPGDIEFVEFCLDCYKYNVLGIRQVCRFWCIKSTKIKFFA